MVAIVALHATIFGEDPTIGTCLATISNDTRQTDTLTRLRIAASAGARVTLVAVTRGATIAFVFPVINSATIALTSGDAGFAKT